MLVMFSPRNGRCKSVNSASEWPFPKQLLLLTTSVTSNPSFIRLIKPLWGVTKNGRTHWKSKTNKLTFLWCSRCGFGVFHLQLFSIYSFKWADYRDPNRNWVFCFSLSKKMTNAWSPTEGENTIGLFLFFEPRSRKKKQKNNQVTFWVQHAKTIFLQKSSISWRFDPTSKWNTVFSFSLRVQCLLHSVANLRSEWLLQRPSRRQYNSGEPIASFVVTPTPTPPPLAPPSPLSSPSREQARALTLIDFLRVRFPIWLPTWSVKFLFLDNKQRWSVVRVKAGTHRPAITQHSRAAVWQ